MTMLHIHIVAYAGNAHTLPYALKAARRAWPAAPIAILDDADAPLPPHVQREIAKAPGVEYRRTRWPREGNLRGRACLRGLLREYKRSMRRSGASYVVKLDADTLVLDPGLLGSLIIGGVDYATHSTLDGPYGGGVILMSRDAVHALTRAVHHAVMPARAREDLTLGGLALASGVLRVISLDGCTPVTADGSRVYYASADTRESANADYVSRMSTHAAVVNVGTSRITGADHASEARMAARLIEAQLTNNHKLTTI